MPGMDGFQVMEGAEDERQRRLPAGAGDHGPARPQAARAAGRRQGFHQQAVRPGRGEDAHPQHAGSAAAVPAARDDYSKMLEAAVRERTAELRESEARYRSLTELASDWYWEQDANGNFTKVRARCWRCWGCGWTRWAAPQRGAGSGLEPGPARGAAGGDRSAPALPGFRLQPHRRPTATQQQFQVSGEPMFGPACEFIGYRGIGLEITDRRQPWGSWPHRARDERTRGRGAPAARGQPAAGACPCWSRSASESTATAAYTPAGHLPGDRGP